MYPSHPMHCQNSSQLAKPTKLSKHDWLFAIQRPTHTRYIYSTSSVWVVVRGSCDCASVMCISMATYLCLTSSIHVNHLSCHHGVQGLLYCPHLVWLETDGSIMMAHVHTPHPQRTSDCLLTWRANCSEKNGSIMTDSLLPCLCTEKYSCPPNISLIGESFDNAWRMIFKGRSETTFPGNKKYSYKHKDPNTTSSLPLVSLFGM